MGLLVPGPLRRQGEPCPGELGVRDQLPSRVKATSQDPGLNSRQIGGTSLFFQLPHLPLTPTLVDLPEGQLQRQERVAESWSPQDRVELCRLSVDSF